MSKKLGPLSRLPPRAVECVVRALLNPTAALSRHLNARGMLVWPLKSNDADSLERMVSIGVNAVLTDRPGWLHRQLPASGGRIFNDSQGRLPPAAPQYCQ